jgi:hypothetical protein
VGRTSEGGRGVGGDGVGGRRARERGIKKQAQGWGEVRVDSDSGEDTSSEGRAMTNGINIFTRGRRTSFDLWGDCQVIEVSSQRVLVNSFEILRVQRGSESQRKRCPAEEGRRGAITRPCALSGNRPLRACEMFLDFGDRPNSEAVVRSGQHFLAIAVVATLESSSNVW